MMINAANNAVMGIKAAGKTAAEVSAKMSKAPFDDEGLAENIVKMNMAKHRVSANAKVIQTAREAEENLLDIIV